MYFNILASIKSLTFCFRRAEQKLYAKLWLGSSHYRDWGSGGRVIKIIVRMKPVWTLWAKRRGHYKDSVGDETSSLHCTTRAYAEITLPPHP